ncbi:MAG: FtsW/RodA/SpoVE family cell cycle protein [Actinomycetota bacterium]|nr:FtsW/RodA/SpoVE family cell cycle protein [Actinomycetota bacterium]
MRPRTAELGLLVMASLITVSAYGLTSLGRAASLPANIVPFLGIVLGLLLGGHLVVRQLAPLADGLLLPLAALLNGLGYVVIARLDPDLAASQSAWTFIGLCGFAVTLIAVKDVRRLESYRYSLALLGVVLLLLPLLPGLGVNINGARIWLRVGPFSIQPGEFAKVVLAAFLAGYLVDKRELLMLSNRRVGPLHLPDFKYFGPLLLAWGVALVVIVAERDLGSSLLFFALFVVMLYLSTGRTAYVLTGLTMFGGGAYLAFRNFSHVQRRVDIWLHPFDDPKNAGFQIVEASFALADGGITGTGLGLGTPGKIPYAPTDMIFAAIGEETGLLGASAVLITFILFAATGFRVASQSTDDFEKLLAAGLTALLSFQAFVIVGGILRVLPLTGVTLPFVSYGGSSLIANYVILALLVRISDRSRRAVAS